MMKKQHILYAFIFFSLSSVATTGHAQPFDTALAGKLQDKLDRLVTTYNLKGVSASVFYPGQGMWLGVSGQSNAGVPITPDMVFGIGSNTKLFTAVALLKLIERNIIRLDDSLHQWLPAFTNVNPNTTIRQILNHTSGIADITDYQGYADSILSNPNRVWRPQELLKWVEKPLFPPGTGGSYSNTNYLLAGLVFESALGQPIVQFIRDSILNPLALDSTFFDVEETVLGSIAHPWQNGVDINNVPRVSLNSAAWTAGAIYSTASEMTQWYMALLHGRLLQPSSFATMTQFANPGSYGLGIGQQTAGGRIVWGHGGSIRGYRSRMLYDTTSKAIVCVLANSNPVDINAVAVELLLALVDNPVSGLLDTNHDHMRPVLFPNPASDELRIEQLPPSFTGEASITDLWGKIHLRQAIHGGQAHIATGQLPQGMYFVSILQEKNIVSVTPLLISGH